MEYRRIVLPVGRGRDGARHAVACRQRHKTIVDQPRSALARILIMWEHVEHTHARYAFGALIKHDVVSEDIDVLNRLGLIRWLPQ